MHIKLKRTPGVYLAGFMGSGKSTVGHMLAGELGWDFVDLDTEIEKQEHTSIGEIFEQRGEPEFRRIESEMIRTYVRRTEQGIPTVIALGGGAFVQPDNFEIIQNHGITIWIDCSFDSIQRRLAELPQVRPLARDPEKFARLYEERRAGYARADFRVEGDCATESTVAAVLALPIWK